MIKLNSTFGVAPLLVLAGLLLAGCGSGGGGHSHIDDDPALPPAPPELEGFHVIDSYGFSTEDSPTLQPALNPYVDDGLFETYWYAYSHGDYTVELSVNDRPSFAGSRLISNDYCGTDLPCEQDGWFYCQYYSDFSVSCDSPDVSDPNIYLTYFDDWIVALPQTLYFILEVCDTLSNSCEFQIREVSVE